jgi:NifB/MoaA-like Fe-S oxidoreductase
MNVDKYMPYFSQNYNSEKNNIEEIILNLRQMGASQVETIRVIMNGLGLTLSESDTIVLNSVAWNDTKDSTDEFREDLGDFLDNL